MNQKIIQTTDIKKHFTLNKQQVVKSVDGISIDIYQGETFGLVGESGSGKSTLGKVVVGLTTPTDGAVYYGGRNVENLSKKEKRQVNREIQMIFQDPQASLNPRMQVGEIIAEGIDAHGLAKGKKRKDRVCELLEKVGLSSDVIKRYPHEFSGGQKQRIGIARTLAVQPRFIVADEPISALDVSIQAQILNLLNDLKDAEELTYLFIAHDLSMVKYISDRIGVMYLGNMMELANSQELFSDPKHPYTRALLSAIPVPDPTASKRNRIVLKGDPPSPVNPPSGCKFRTRCPYAMEICSLKKPEWKEENPGHWVACHLYA